MANIPTNQENCWHWGKATKKNMTTVLFDKIFFKSVQFFCVEELISVPHCAGTGFRNQMLCSRGTQNSQTNHDFSIW